MIEYFIFFSQKEFIEGDERIEKIEGELEVSDLSFSYSKDTDEKILDNINIKIPQRKILAIVGATGSGKSTLIRLISKLYTGYTGSIKIDGIDLTNLDSQVSTTYCYCSLGI